MYLSWKKYLNKEIHHYIVVKMELNNTSGYEMNKYLLDRYTQRYQQAGCPSITPLNDVKEFSIDDILKDEMSLMQAKVNFILAQIKEREYADRYRSSAEIIYLVGIEFGRIEKNVVNVEYEEIKSLR